MQKTIFLVLFSIIVGVSSTCTDNSCNVCGNKIKVLDPSLNMGKISCTDHGKYSKGCKYIHEIKPICTLTPLEEQNVGNCYHYNCRWNSKDSFKIKMHVKDPYDTIYIDLYPTSDLSPAATMIILCIMLILWFCMLSSQSADAFVAGYTGGVFSSWGSSGGGSGSSSGIC